MIKLRGYLRMTSEDDYYIHAENDHIYTAVGKVHDIPQGKPMTFLVAEITGDYQPALGVVPVAKVVGAAE